ncbi:hypothetical protein NKH53_31600 [Mesorhizobium australicum]|uniref:hypothetical protein n=1 Tax=Mesorhizobium australicum TaxID=536018 RepID=UPI003338BC92
MTKHGPEVKLLIAPGGPASFREAPEERCRGAEAIQMRFVAPKAEAQQLPRFRADCNNKAMDQVVHTSYRGGGLLLSFCRISACWASKSTFLATPLLLALALGKDIE